MVELHIQNDVPMDGRQPDSAGRQVNAPQDGHPIPPDTEQDIRHRRRDSATGWILSVIVHGSLFLCFAGITWYHGAGPGTQALSVGISEGPPQASLGMGQAQSIPLPPSRQVETEIPLTPSSEDEAIAQPDLNVSSPPQEAVDVGLIGQEADTGQAWDSFAATAANSGGGGASFFGLAARGGKFIYVVDRSGSMEGQPLQAAKSELIRSISAMERQMKFYIFFYNMTSLPMDARDLVRATAENRDYYIRWVQSIQGEGGTDPTEAMRQALALKPDAIWLLSDGLFSETAAEVIRQANPGGAVRINTIAFYNNTGEPILKKIARENGGRYRFVAPPKNMKPFGY